MYHVLSSAIGISLSFSLIEIIYSPLFISDNFLYIMLPFVSALCFTPIYNKTKQNVIFPIVTIAITIYSAICFTIEHINDVTIDNFSFTAIIYFIMALIFSIVSFYIKQNRTFGIRTVATLKYEQVWNKTHKIYSLISFVSIPFIYTFIFWYSGWIRFLLLNITFITPLIISYFISYAISKPYVNSEHLKQQTELEKQKKREEEGKYK